MTRGETKSFEYLRPLNEPEVNRLNSSVASALMVGSDVIRPKSQYCRAVTEL